MSITKRGKRSKLSSRSRSLREWKPGNPTTSLPEKEDVVPERVTWLLENGAQLTDEIDN